MTGKYPSGLFVVGVRKCGTTTVFDFLKNTGAFSPCRIKEPQFFCLDDEVIVHNLNWYAGLFDPGKNNRPLLDGSTLYYQYPASRRRIEAQFADARFVVCLRDPARRMFSAYWHQRAKPGGVERRSFDKVLADLETGAGANLAAIEQTRLEQAVATGQIAPGYPGRDYHRRHYGAPFDTNGLDPLAFFRYAAESQYSRQAENWLHGPDTHLIFFEQLLREPAVALRRLLEFAGLPSETPLAMPSNRNKTHDAGRSWLLGRLVRAGLFDAIKRRTPDAVKYFFKEKFLPETEKMTAGQYDRARRLLGSEYEFWFERYPVLEGLWQC